jgi:peptidoglycan hydrolase CwlO-like protein
VSAINTLKVDVWKFSTIFLMVLLIISWVWMIITSIIHDASTDTIRSQGTKLRELTDQTITLNMQIQDLQSRNKALNERIDTLNAVRQRDYDYLQSQINRGPIKTIR